MRGTCEKYYNYKVIHDDEICLFSMTRDIKEKYGIPINTIFQIINKKNKKKWLDFHIEKIKEPRWTRTEITYD